MIKDEIRNRVKQLKTTVDFATLLDDIKREEFGTGKYIITAGKLAHFAYVATDEEKYKKFHIRKKSGGLRDICAPRYQPRLLLYLINIVLKAVYTPSESVMGFTEGRSVVDNARMHTGHHYVFNIDLKNFFPSIPQARVWKRLQLPPFNFPKEIANVVAGLCCTANPEHTGNVLPQGSPTSPLLTNAVCDKLDRRMRGVARRFGLHYSRYADDMTFSSMHNVYQEDSDFRREIRRIIEEQGFTMNDDKTRLLRDGRRQEVTGLTVNSIVNVSRKYVSDLRWLIHIWETEGYARAYSQFYPRYKKEKGYIKKGEPVMENVIGGKLNYLKMVKGTGNPAYQKLQARYNKLASVVFVDNETDKGESYIYVQPYSMEEFKEYFSTDITLEISKNHKLTGRCVLAGMDKTISISRSAQRELCSQADTLEPGTVVTSGKLDKCFVTLCQSKGKNFWLITTFEPSRLKCLSIQNAHIDIDKLLAIWRKSGLEVAVKAFHKALQGNETACVAKPPHIQEPAKQSASCQADDQHLQDILERLDTLGI